MDHLFNQLDVAIISGAARYTADPPFDPPADYPERLPHATRLDPSNSAYGMVREALRRLGLDVERYGQPSWNPLGQLIKPGQRVLIKPNFVLHFNAGGGPLEAVVTHPAILRAIADYVMIALGDGGEIIIGDAPQMNADFAALCAHTGMDALAAYLQQACQRRGIQFRLIDFRQERTVYKHGIVWERIPLNDLASHPVPVRLGDESYMEAIDTSRLYGADYARQQTINAHQVQRHEYVIASAALTSDVVISVPKLKVHRKVGTTLNLKNMVGINTDKNHLAHYRIGAPAEGGDEFNSPRWDDRAERRLMDWLLGADRRFGKQMFLAWRAFRKLYHQVSGKPQAQAFTYGNWRGNDTAWRMVLDLNRILRFADASGNLQAHPTRTYFSVVDGLIGGQGEGPLHPEPYPSGVVLAGFNPLAVDWVATRLMGFDPARMRLYANAAQQMREWLPGFDISHCRIHSNVAPWQGLLDQAEPVFQFRAPAGWRGAVELYETAGEAPATTPSPLGAISQ
ncbi:MAG TPA: DUF362 domain-containing protein [Blastocatellia bacterium]|nr:DUF362 domain-containing protein [Blastocatellia bacterium]